MSATMRDVDANSDGESGTLSISCVSATMRDVDANSDGESDTLSISDEDVKSESVVSSFIVFGVHCV